MNDLDTFVGRLRYAKMLREAELGTSIGDKEIAARAGVSPSAVSQWMSGKVNVDNLRAAPVFRVARFLRVRSDWLWEKRGPMRDAQDDLPQAAQAFYADLKKAIALGMTEVAITAIHAPLKAVLAMHERARGGLLDLNAPTPSDDSDSNQKPPRT
ncbi:helix-turn-helix transcriptional regulator [Burkholderia cenocepacia]|uniref:helix-turn-helix domain-containing protein n=1 Tax=Burkholderia cenocepacia TaxID=95486 RepID=UPI001B8DC417|nr:helix-turn-helix transcriptional regulator [Burkholderia cenocepacia]MBR8028894.1 helix-turn-helix transcriptional regulator [Burkholderia cenocepacia]MBR8172022.1 helix-turn-helix transcriptional regulator [Burkholderia cenocepacia]